MKPQRAVVLVRISDDREGEEKGVTRQQADCRHHAHSLSWEVGEVVIENDTSAFKRRKVRLPDGTMALRVIRPGFRRVLEMLATGEADGLIAYDLDRAVRDPRDLEDLIDVVEQRRIPVTSVSGSLRLANDADITMARVMVAVANKSSRDTARRVARKHEELAEAGKPGGGGRRAFGYEPDGMTVRESEAEAIREMAALLLDPDEAWSLYAVAKHLNETGPPPAYAAEWSARAVSSILGGPRITGLRRFRGEIVGDAAWPQILDRETWDAVQVVLRNRRGEGTNNGLVRWLTGVLTCGLCNHDLYGWQGGPGPKYWCATPRGGCGRIVVTATLAEAEIERQILEYLAKPEVLSALRGAYSSGSVGEARAELAADEQQLKELAAMWARREVSFAEYSEARKIITDRIKMSQALVRSALPGVVRTLLTGDLDASWEGLKPADRRAVVLAIVPKGYQVMPASRGRKIFEPDRLVPITE